MLKTMDKILLDCGQSRIFWLTSVVSEFPYHLNCFVQLFMLSLIPMYLIHTMISDELLR